MSRPQKSKKSVAPLTAFEDIFTTPKPQPPKDKAPPSLKFSAKSKKIVVPGSDHQNHQSQTPNLPGLLEKQRDHNEVASREGGLSDTVSFGYATFSSLSAYLVILITSIDTLYEPLLDEDLRDYFSSANIRKHLQKVGLITAEGKVIPKKRFKKQQVHLDHLQWQEQNVKKQEEMDLDRDIEYAIRRQMEEEKNRISNTHIELPTNLSPSKSYPEFLSSYPVTMWKTVLLYSESNANKPPSLALTEKELLQKLQSMSRQKLKDYGLDPEKILPKIELLKSKLRRKSGVRSRPPVHDDISELELEHGSPILKLFGMARRHYESNDINGTKLVLHELVKLMSDSPKSSMAALKTKSVEELDAIDEIKKKSAVPLEATELLLMGYIQKLGGDVDTIITQLQQKKLAETRPSSSSRTIKQIESTIGQTSLSTLSAPPTLRPKSARPTREADFPIGSEFSDFGGSEAGCEVSEQIMANTGAQDVVAKPAIDPVQEHEEAAAEYSSQFLESPTKGSTLDITIATDATNEYEADMQEFESGLEDTRGVQEVNTYTSSEAALLEDDSYLDDLIATQPVSTMEINAIDGDQELKQEFEADDAVMTSDSGEGKEETELDDRPDAIASFENIECVDENQHDTNTVAQVESNATISQEPVTNPEEIINTEYHESPAEEYQVQQNIVTEQQMQEQPLADSSRINWDSDFHIPPTTATLDETYAEETPALQESNAPTAVVVVNPSEINWDSDFNILATTNAELASDPPHELNTETTKESEVAVVTAVDPAEINWESDFDFLAATVSVPTEPVTSDDPHMEYESEIPESLSNFVSQQDISHSQYDVDAIQETIKGPNTETVEQESQAVSQEGNTTTPNVNSAQEVAPNTDLEELEPQPPVNATISVDSLAGEISSIQAPSCDDHFGSNDPITSTIPVTSQSTEFQPSSEPSRGIETPIASNEFPEVSIPSSLQLVTETTQLEPNEETRIQKSSRKSSLKSSNDGVSKKSVSFGNIAQKALDAEEKQVVSQKDGSQSIPLEEGEIISLASSASHVDKSDGVISVHEKKKLSEEIHKDESLLSEPVSPIDSDFQLHNDALLDTDSTVNEERAAPEKELSESVVGKAASEPNLPKKSQSNTHLSIEKFVSKVDEVIESTQKADISSMNQLNDSKTGEVQMCGEAQKSTNLSKTEKIQTVQHSETAQTKLQSNHASVSELDAESESKPVFDELNYDEDFEYVPQPIAAEITADIDVSQYLDESEFERPAEELAEPMSDPKEISYQPVITMADGQSTESAFQTQLDQNEIRDPHLVGEPSEITQAAESFVGSTTNLGILATELQERKNFESFESLNLPPQETMGDVNLSTGSLNYGDDFEDADAQEYENASGSKRQSQPSLVQAQTLSQSSLVQKVEIEQSASETNNHSDFTPKTDIPLQTASRTQSQSNLVQREDTESKKPNQSNLVQKADILEQPASERQSQTNLFQKADISEISQTSVIQEQKHQEFSSQETLHEATTSVQKSASQVDISRNGSIKTSQDNVAQNFADPKTRSLESLSGNIPRSEPNIHAASSLEASRTQLVASHPNIQLSEKGTTANRSAGHFAEPRRQGSQLAKIAIGGSSSAVGSIQLNGSKLSVASDESDDYVSPMSFRSSTAAPQRKASMLVSALVRRASLSPSSPVALLSKRASVAHTPETTVPAEPEDDLIDNYYFRPSRVMERRPSQKSPLAATFSQKDDDSDEDEEEEADGGEGQTEKELTENPELEPIHSKASLSTSATNLNVWTSECQGTQSLEDSRWLENLVQLMANRFPNTRVPKV
ncbi:UNVERIFIED_CONTAM: hypothetical protein HDU68_010161 [Siphonaria sp. JEL0065]|nr:hypothetical protein HDU68_010161 [Siphonaria sp. JEL0065]